MTHFIISIVDILDMVICDVTMNRKLLFVIDDIDEYFIFCKNIVFYFDIKIIWIKIKIMNIIFDII